MPRYARRSRPAYAKKIRVMKRKRLVRRRRPAGGSIRLIRKVAEQNVYNTSVLGTPAASGAVVTIGAAYQTPPFAGVGTYYNIPFAISTKLNDLLSFTELTALADKYKINWVKVKVFCNSSIASTASTAQLPSLLYTLDDDDVTLPASSTTGLNTIREKMSSRLRQFKPNAPITMFYKPKMQAPVNTAAGVIVASGVQPAKWVDCSVVDVPHFGVKGFIQDANLATTASTLTQFKFDITMSVSLKDIQ